MPFGLRISLRSVSGQQFTHYALTPFPLPLFAIVSLLCRSGHQSGCPAADYPWTWLWVPITTVKSFSTRRFWFVHSNAGITTRVGHTAKASLD